MKKWTSIKEYMFAKQATRKKVDLFVNPTSEEWKEINSAGGNCRGIATASGNVLLAMPENGVIHQDIVDFAISEGALKKGAKPWKEEIGNFIGIKQVGTTTQFELADSYTDPVVEAGKEQIDSILKAVKGNKEGMGSKFNIVPKISKASN